MDCLFQLFRQEAIKAENSVTTTDIGLFKALQKFPLTLVIYNLVSYDAVNRNKHFLNIFLHFIFYIQDQSQ
jgi:hypothetical protein